MGCRKWLNGVLKEAEVNVIDTNKVEIDEVILMYIGEQSSYGRCSVDWRKALEELTKTSK